LADNHEVQEEEPQQLEDLESLRRVLAEEREKADRYLTSWQRSQADFANYKRRVEEERAETIECANSALILKLLPVLDDLDRALASIPAEQAESSWTEGMRLIYNKTKAILEGQGLCEVEAEGEPFDPRFHEAIMQVEGEEGKVIEQIQKGYEFKDKLIRPCLVTVGRGIEKRQPKPKTSKEEQ